MMLRKVEPEILDSLSAEDPRAIKSRKDLKRINLLMGNYRWIHRTLMAESAKSIIELGSGDGTLLSYLKEKSISALSLTGIDLAPRPPALPAEIEWEQGDLFHILPRKEADTLVVNLLLHHFSEEALAEIGTHLHSFKTLIFNEPYRSKLPILEGYLLFPFISEVTKHDMIVSIKAGFRKGELSKIMQLEAAGFSVEEQVTATGSLRIIARKVASL